MIGVHTLYVTMQESSYEGMFLQSLEAEYIGIDLVWQGCNIASAYEIEWLLQLQHESLALAAGRIVADTRGAPR